MSAIDRAYSLAEAALAPHLPDRWLHVQGVASLAQILGDTLPDVDREALLQAAWLHDIGYSPDIKVCGFHPLDGARYLAEQGVEAKVVALVAHHSGAVVEARLRGVDGLDRFPDPITPTRDALWYCDAATGPRGQRWTVQERWSEVRHRYGPTHLVSCFLDEAEPILHAAVDRTRQRMREAGLRES